MSSDPDRGKTSGGLAVFLGFVTGIASLLLAVLALFTHEWVAAAISLGSAGLAFGFIANAALRH